MKLEYNGWEKDRKMKNSSFLPNIRAHIASLIDVCEPQSEINILDIGCGIDASFLQNIKEDPEILGLLDTKNASLNLHAISADSKVKPPYVTHYPQFLTVNNGLSFIPSDIQFDLIYSSWCINYLGPNTFERLVKDSLDKIKNGKYIFLNPYEPVKYSSAFPKALDLTEDYKSIIPSLLQEEKLTELELQKVKGNFLKLIRKLQLEEVMGERLEQLKKSSDIEEIWEIFCIHILMNNLLDEYRIQVTMDYSINIFELKQRRLAKILEENPNINKEITNWRDFDTLILKKEI